MPALDDCAALRAPRSTPRATRSPSAWRPAGCSAPAAGPASPTWRRSRGGPSAAIRALAGPGDAWREPGPLRPRPGRRSGRPSGRSSATRSADGRDSCPISEPERCPMDPPDRPTPTPTDRPALAPPGLVDRGRPGLDRPARPGRADRRLDRRPGPPRPPITRPTPTATTDRAPDLALARPATRPRSPPATMGDDLGHPRPEGLGEDQDRRRPRRPRPSSTPPRSSSTPGELRRGRAAPQAAGQARGQEGHALGREGPVLPGRDPVPAASSTSRPTTATSSSIKKYPGHRVRRQDRRPRVPDRPDLALGRGPQGQAPALEGPVRRPAAAARRPATPSRPSTTSAHHDPQGPLADDAALRTADHYHTVGDYETAAVYYDQLLTEHPKSPLRERAQLSSIDAKMKGYIGPEYDVTGLESARETIKRTMAEFPEHQAVNGEGLYHTLDLISDQEAERATSSSASITSGPCKPTSAEYYFGLVQAKWPKSKWAGEARRRWPRSPRPRARPASPARS